MRVITGYEGYITTNHDSSWVRISDKFAMPVWSGKTEYCPIIPDSGEVYPNQYMARITLSREEAGILGDRDQFEISLDIEEFGEETLRRNRERVRLELDAYASGEW